MRAILSTLICLSLSGCLFGASRGQTTTTFVDDPGNGPVHRQTYTSNASGMYVGGNIPLMGGAGMNVGGGAYGGATIVGGGYGGGNTACVLHPDRCAVMQTAVVIQPISISSSGGGNAAGNGGRSSGGGAAAEPSDDGALSAMLAKHEKALSSVVPSTKQNVRQLCQILIVPANAEAITDPDERKEVVEGCQDFLAKHPYTKTAAKEAK